MRLLIYHLLITTRLSKFPRPLQLFDTDEGEGLCVCMHVGECTCVKLHASLSDLGFDITLRILPAHSPPSKCPITDLISLKHAQWSNQDQALPQLSQ